MFTLDLKGQSTNLPNVHDCKNCHALKFATGIEGNPKTAADRQMAFDRYVAKRNHIGRDADTWTDVDGRVYRHHEYDRAGADEDDEFDRLNADEAEREDEARREQRNRLMRFTADYFSQRGMSEDAIETMLKDFPPNGLEHLGGQLDQDLSDLMESRRERRMASDRKRRLAQDRRRERHDHLGINRIGLGDAPLFKPIGGNVVKQQLAQDQTVANAERAQLEKDMARISTGAFSTFKF